MNDLVNKEETQIAQADQSGAVLSMIERVASNPDADMDKLERLLDMQERILNRSAEMAFNRAMNEAQSEMGPVSADSNNPQTRSRYASYAQLDRALRSIYSKHGFSLSFGTGDPIQDAVEVICYVSHAEGHTRRYQVVMPADGKGAKGGDVMTKTHATGAAMSYGMRYLLKLIFNVAIGEFDDDGNLGDIAELAGACKEISGAADGESLKATFASYWNSFTSKSDRKRLSDAKDARKKELGL